MDYEPNGNLSLLENFLGPEDTERNNNKNTSYKQLGHRREKLKLSISNV
jgi:hypothetical protein